jgi:hypothetical protein
VSASCCHPSAFDVNGLSLFAHLGANLFAFIQGKGALNKEGRQITYCGAVSRANDLAFPRPVGRPQPGFMRSSAAVLHVAGHEEEVTLEFGRAIPAPGDLTGAGKMNANLPCANY